MSSKHELAVVIMGYKPSPLVSNMIESNLLNAKFVTSNVLDFSIHHADPKKILHYHLELTNLLEAKARKSMESLAIIDKLGQFFEFYNPLKLSTLNYLISKYITSLNTTNKGFTRTWQEVATAIFEDDFVLPLFEETRIVHVNEGDVEIPARQHVMTKEVEAKREPEKPAQAKGKKKGHDDEGEDKRPGTSGGVIDIELVEKMQLGEATWDFMEKAAGVILVPTDMLSLHVLFSSNEFKDMLKNTQGKIVLVAPVWPGNELSEAERDILEASGFKPTLEHLAKLVKNHVDAIVVHEISGETLQKIRESGMTVLVEKLDVDHQRDELLLERVMKCIGLELDDFRAEERPRKQAIGEKLADILGMKIGRKDEEAVSAVDEPASPGEGKETAGDAKPTELVALAGVPPGVVTGPAAPAAITAPAAPAAAPAVTIPPATVDAVDQAAPVLPPAADDVDVTPLPPPSASIQENGEIGEKAPVLDIFEEIANVIAPSYTCNIETVFARLLDWKQESETMLEEVLAFLIKKMQELADEGPEGKIGDIVTYLVAHNQDRFPDFLNDLLAKTMKIEEETLLLKHLHASKHFMRASQAQSEQTLRGFIMDAVQLSSYLEIERARRVLTYFITTDRQFSQVIMTIMLDIFKEQLEHEVPDQAIIDRILFFSRVFDAYTMGQALIEKLPEAYLGKIQPLVEALCFSKQYNNVLVDIITAYQENEYEALKKALNVKKIPATLQSSIVKRRYITQLSKVGSMPLALFAEKIGMTATEAEKMIVDSILKGDIAAKIEIVDGKPYLISEKKTEAKPAVKVKPDDAAPDAGGDPTGDAVDPGEASPEKVPELIKDPAKPPSKAPVPVASRESPAIKPVLRETIEEPEE